MQRLVAPALAVALLVAGEAAGREPDFDPVDYALRRAALELAAGRPQAAAAVLGRVSFDGRAGKRQALGLLLEAEACLLAGESERARAALEHLAAVDDESIRARAAAHALALRLERHGVAPDVEAEIRALEAWESDREALDSDEAGLGDLVAASLALASGDSLALRRALERVRNGAAVPGALLWRAEMALDVGGTEDAVKRFRELERVAPSDADGWFAGWARVGLARARAVAGDTSQARAVLESIAAPAALAAEARLASGTLALAAGDPQAAARAFAGLDLGPWNPTLEAEARLLELQAALDRGEWMAAESLGVGLRQSLPDLETAASAPPVARTLAIDLGAFHAALSARTLAALEESDVLRRRPEKLRLAPETSVVALDADSTRAARRDRVRLRPLLVHESEPEVVEAERVAWREANAASELVAWRKRAHDAAQERLQVRLALVARGRAGLEMCRAEVARLAEESARLRAGVAAHTARVAALEETWRRMLQGRLVALAAMLAELERADVRLDARYPEDRSVREREPTGRARAAASGTAAWVAAAESLQTDVASRLGARLQAIFQQHELGSDLAALDSLDVTIAALAVRAEGLARALDEADAAERQEVARAESLLAVAVTQQTAAQATALGRAAATQAALAATAEARAAAYGVGADWGRATAAFLAALSTPREDDRMARLERAVQALQEFADAHPESPHAPEALYRLGECALQRAAIEYETDLAAFVAGGGRAEQAPVPVQGYSEALATYRRLRRDYPGSPRAQDAAHQLGFVLAEMGAIEESSHELESFLAAADSLDPRVARAALRLGEDRLLLGDGPAALAAFRRAARAADPETCDLGLFKAGWCAYDLDLHDEARGHLQALLAHALADSAASPRAIELAPEALELLSLAFAADHDAQAAARALDAWGRPAYDFAVLQRMAQLFASRALYDEAIATDELLLDRYPAHPALPAVGEDLLRWIEVRHGSAAMHTRAASLAPLFAPGGTWAQAAARERDNGIELRPRWQSRLVSEDAAAVRDDSLAVALSRPEAAATRMAARLRAAAVFEHRAAQRDSLGGAPAGYRRAAALYERALALFPGAEDEPTTWLYLGEARFGFDDLEHAADAYGEAARHPRADSALAHTAAGQELAACDAAAARAPERFVERYGATAERFAASHPADPRAVDALSRVGELAFAASKWDLSERAYLQVAERTPEERRAAGALKMVGDVDWKRDRFEAAAGRYDEALSRARRAGADSLAGALERLVPAALQRGAEQREAQGDRDGAAAAFEDLAASHPRYEFADRALYRAAGLRAAGGDSARAADDHARLVRDHPQSALVPDARLELARCRESTGERLPAARAYREFATRHHEHPQARPARLRAGLLFAAAGPPAPADSEYAVVLAAVHPPGKPPLDAPLAADLWVRRVRLAPDAAAAAPHWRRALECGDALAAPERAEATFQVTEVALPAYRALELRQPLSETLPAKQKALESLVAGYAKSAEAEIEPWHAAACLRLGETLAEFGDALRSSEPPADLEGEDLYAYQETLAQQAQALEDRAVDTWSRGLAAARRAGHRDDWTRATEENLYPRLAVRVPTRPAPLFVLVEP